MRVGVRGRTLTKLTTLTLPLGPLEVWLCGRVVVVRGLVDGPESSTLALSDLGEVVTLSAVADTFVAPERPA